MVLTARREFFKHTIYDESGQELVHIRHKFGNYAVENPDNIKILDVGEHGQTKLTFNGAHLRGHADIQLKEHQNHLLMPRAEQVELHLADKTYRICQSEQRTFPILCDGKPTAYISNMLSRTVQIEAQESLDTETVALLFVSSIIMLHEDDEILV